MMRDIRPAKDSRPEGYLEPDFGAVTPMPAGRPLRQPHKAASPNQSANPAKKNPQSGPFRGTSVPVTNINLPSENPTPAMRRKKVIQGNSPVPMPTADKVRIGHRERKVLLTLLLLLAAAGVLAAIIFLPQADIKLILRTAPLLVDEQLVVTAQAGAETNVVAGSAFFREVEAEGTSSVTSTEIIGKKATGTVTLVNRTVEEQKIKERSRLVTKDDVLLYMLKSATISPDSSVTVDVEAAEAGEKGNIQPQRLNFAALEPASQALVYGEATKTLTGGSGETVAVVKEADIEKAKAEAGTVARNQVEQDIRGELPRGWVILEESWTTEVTSFETEAKVDSRLQSIPYKARVIVRVIGHEKEALEKHLKTALENRMAEDYMLFPGPIAYTATVEEVNWEESKATISARVTHTTIPRFSLETLRGKLAGQKATDAKKYLEGLPGVRSTTLDLSPFWVQSIPRIDKRIKLDLQPERQP